MSGILPILRKANNNILAGLIEKADLNNTLNGDPLAEPGDLREVTLFAPTDRAFNEFGGLPAARDDPEVAKKLVLAHVVEGKLHEETLKNLDGMKKANLDGGEVLFRVKKPGMDEERKGEGAREKYNATGITVGGARMSTVSSDGKPSKMRYKVVIHLMDDVIDPADPSGSNYEK